MNCMSKMEVGDLLAQIHQETKDLSHYQRGVYFGQHAKLEQYHNSFANKNISTPEQRLQNKMGSSSSLYASELEAVSTATTVDQFHYISFVPINNRLYELDGLKPHPINHGGWREDRGETWVDRFRQVIRDRVLTFDSEVCFNLLSVIPDKRRQLRSKIQYLEANKENMMEITRQLVKKFHPSMCNADDSRVLGQLRTMSPNSGTLMQRGFFDLQKKITWFKTYPDFLASPLISNQEKQLYFEIKSNLESPQSEISDASETVKSSGADHSGTNIFVKIEQASDHSRTTTPTNISSSESNANQSKSDASDISPSDLSDNLPLSSLQKEVKREMRSNSPLVVEPESTSTLANIAALNIQNSCKMEQLFVDTQSENNTSDSNKDGSGHFFLAAPRIHQLMELIDKEIETCRSNLKEEMAKRQKYVVDQKRRSHNYQDFILKYFAYALKYGLFDVEKTTGSYTIKQRSSDESSDSSMAKTDLNSSKDKNSDQCKSLSGQSSNSNHLQNGTASNGSNHNSSTSSGTKPPSKTSALSIITSSDSSTVSTNSSLASSNSATVRAASSPVFSESRRKSKVPKRR